MQGSKSATGQNDDVGAVGLDVVTSSKDKDGAVSLDDLINGNDEDGAVSRDGVINGVDKDGVLNSEGVIGGIDKDGVLNSEGVIGSSFGETGVEALNSSIQLRKLPSADFNRRCWICYACEEDEDAPDDD